MGQGLRVYNSDGVLTLDTDFRLTRVIGTVYIQDFSDNAINIPEFSQGTPWVIPFVNWNDIIKKDADWATYPYFINPSIEGTTLKWIARVKQNNTPGGGYTPGIYYKSWLMYGVY